MNKRDYVMRAIHHEATDKVPCCIRLTKEAPDAYGDRLLQDYHNPEVMADLRKRTHYQGTGRRAVHWQLHDPRSHRLVELGVNILNPVQPECMDLKFLKDTYGQHITFWGGISTQGVLPFGTPGEVAAETQRVIDLMSAGGGYITCSSQEIQTDVPYENLKALIDTARANG